MLTPLFAVVLAFYAFERAAEIALNRRNARVLARRGAVWSGPRDGFKLIVAAQVALFGGLVVESILAPWARPKPWTLACLAALALAMALRYWCIATLGWRWSVRVVTVPGAPRIVGGPYRWFPHPNYAVVMAEALLLPLAFGAYATLLVAAPLQAVALARRIRLEERALNAPPAVVDVDR